MTTHFRLDDFGEAIRLPHVLTQRRCSGSFAVMSKPVEYRTAIAGFGTWRIAYDPKTKRWALAYNARLSGEQWAPVGDFLLAEVAAMAVADRKTGARSWDGLRFAVPTSFDLSHWKTDASEGVQEDAST